MTGWLVVVADDMRYDELEHLPTLRRLAAEGTYFTQARVATPVCSPFRASLLTGRRPVGPHGHGIVHQHNPPGPIEADTLAVWLSSAGWATGHFGKYFVGQVATPRPGWSTMRASRGPRHAHQHGYGIVTDDGIVRPDRRQSDYLLEELQAWIARQLDQGGDWFACYCAHEPHTPLEPPPRHHRAFADLRWPYRHEDVSTKPGWVRALPVPTPRQVMAMQGLDTMPGYQRLRLRELLELDDAVEALWQQVRGDDVVVVFVSDNGDMLLEHRLPALAKGVPYDEALRVPLVAAGPGFDGRGALDVPVAADVDITAAVVAAAGATPTQPLDGIDLRELAAHPRAHQRRGVLGHCRARTFAGSHMPASDIWTQVVDGRRWKLIRYPDQSGTDRIELYDLDEDPRELRNLRSAPDLVGTIETLEAALDAELAGVASGSVGP